MSEEKKYGRGNIPVEPNKPAEPVLSEADKARIIAEEKFRAQIRAEEDSKNTSISVNKDSKTDKKSLEERKLAAQKSVEAEKKAAYENYLAIERERFAADPEKEKKRGTGGMTRPEQINAYNTVRREYLTDSERSSEDKKNTILGLLFIALFIIFMGWLLHGCFAGPSPEQRQEQASRDAQAKQLVNQSPYTIQRVCEESVKGKLKAPSTAQFQEDTLPHVVGNSWAWGSSVDAQNSFGAQIRSSFVCSVTGTTIDDAMVSSSLLE